MFTLQDMRDELARVEGALDEWPSELERAARIRRWLGEDSRALFAQAAAEAERVAVIDVNEHFHAYFGGLWHLAGEAKQARRRLKRAASRVDWEPTPSGAAGVLYLLGKFDRAARLAPEECEGWLARGARDRDPSLVLKARDRCLSWQRLGGDAGPHEGSGYGTPLKDWDWIEETFRLEAELRGTPVPSHLDILSACGVLREPGEPVAAHDRDVEPG